MEHIISWLLEGDVSIQYQVHRDLLDTDRPDLQERIASEGWGAAFLAKRGSHGHWGRKFYQPKWISSHYTLLDLRHLCLAPGNEQVNETIDKICREEKSEDGGVNPAETIAQSDVCVNGMFLTYACYFKTKEEKLKSVIDFILTQQLADGGFNCRLNRSGAVHSSMHSTISLLEGITECLQNGYTYRKEELIQTELQAREFLLMHQLFRSDRTGKIIHKDFLKMPFPGRWKYDILRALDYFQYAKAPWDDRLQPAIDVLLQKRNRHNTWNLQAKHPGELHFEMEKAGKASRWNTLRALRVLKQYAVSSGQ